MLHSLVVFGIVLFLNCILLVNSVGIDGREERNRCVLNIVNKNSRRIVLVGKPSVTRNALRKPLYCSYLGIPYARPPIGRLRFEPPQLAPLFGGGSGGDGEPVKKYFTKVGNVCLQMSYSYGGVGENIIGNENCLYLNVHTTAYGTNESPPPPPPSISSRSYKMHRTRNKRSHSPQQQKYETLLPVVLWIHGGSFNLGSSTSDTNGPDYLVEKNVIVVTINYRLGALGFMSVPLANITGNYGLLDQQMAMKWIQRYIVHFGGNRNHVTLMGWSAGAASASYHIYAKSSRNLFHRAIMMSGNMLNPWAYNAASTLCTKSLLHKLKLTAADDDGEMLKTRLQAIKASSFVRKLNRDIFFIYFGSPEYCFVPSLDGNVMEAKPPVLVKESHLHHHHNQVPVLIGATAIENSYSVPFEFKMKNVQFPHENRTIASELNRFLQKLFRDSDDNSKRRRFMHKMRNMADISYGIAEFIRSYVSGGGGKVFLYRFAFDGKFGHFKSEKLMTADVAAAAPPDGGGGGVAVVDGPMHGDDLGYLFGDFYQRTTSMGNDDDDGGDGGAATTVAGGLSENRYDDKELSTAAAAVGVDENSVVARDVRMDLKNEILVRKRMVEMWTNFIKYGDPTPTVNELLNVTWHPYDTDAVGRGFMNINLTMSFDRDVTREGGDFQLWQAIYKCFYENVCNRLHEYLFENKIVDD